MAGGPPRALVNLPVERVVHGDDARAQLRDGRHVPRHHAEVARQRRQEHHVHLHKAHQGQGWHNLELN